MFQRNGSADVLSTVGSPVNPFICYSTRNLALRNNFCNEHNVLQYLTAPLVIVTRRVIAKENYVNSPA